MKTTKLYLAAFTPSNPDGSPNLQAFSSFLTHQANRKYYTEIESTSIGQEIPLFDGIVVFGTTGGNFDFTLAQGIDLITTAGQLKRDGKIPSSTELIAGVGWNTANGAINLSEAANAMGYDKVMIRQPAYTRETYPGDETVFEEYFRPILENTDIPAFLYNIPQRTTLDLSYAVVRMISGIKGLREKIAGIKESSDEGLKRMRELRRQFPWLQFYNGNDRNILQTVKAGAVGVTSGMANGFGILLRRLADEAGRNSRRAPLMQESMNLAIELTRPHEVDFYLSLWGFGPQGIRKPLAEGQMAETLARLEGIPDSFQRSQMKMELVMSTPPTEEFKTKHTQRLTQKEIITLPAPQDRKRNTN
jgi:dihydrodipicolinate synthase/N-acetylneuraminate lyase